VAVKEGFRANSMSVDAMAVNGHLIMVYNKYIVKTEVTDSFSECRVSNVNFIVIDIK
jgi:hypothetical protein